MPGRAQAQRTVPRGDEVGDADPGVEPRMVRVHQRGDEMARVARLRVGQGVRRAGRPGPLGQPIAALQPLVDDVDPALLRLHLLHAGQGRDAGGVAEEEGCF